MRRSLNDVLFDRLAGDAAGLNNQDRLIDHLPARDLAGVEAEFRAIYAGIPADWHRKNNIARFEGYCASVFYACLAALRQLRERGYADNYRATGKSVHLIGVEFSEESRNIASFETATILSQFASGSSLEA